MSAKINRILLLDGIRQQFDETPIILESPSQLDGLIAKWSILENPPDIILDIRQLPQKHFNSLLKFIEDYKGNIILMANDNPVSNPILSRFTQVIKNPEISDKVTDIRYHNVMNGSLFMTNVMKGKILDFLGINVSDVDDDVMFSDEFGETDFEDELSDYYDYD